MTELETKLKKMKKQELIESLLNISNDLQKMNNTIQNQQNKIKNLENKNKSEHFNLNIGDRVFIMCKNYRTYRGLVVLDTNLFLKIKVKNKEEKEWEYVLAKQDIVAIKTYYDEDEEEFNI